MAWRMTYLQSETKSEAGREILIKRIRQTAKDALPNGQDPCRPIPPTRFPLFLPTDLPQRRRTDVASKAHRGMGARPVCHHLPSPGREDTAMLLSPSRPTLRAQDNVQDQGGGPRIGISADVVGITAPRNEEDTAIPGTTAEANDAVAVATGVELPRRDAP
jgi:hypothetical protein